MISRLRLKHGRGFSVAGMFLVIFLPFALLVAGVGAGVYLQERTERQKNLGNKEHLQADFAVRSVSRDIRDMTRDLLFLAGMHRSESLPDKEKVELWTRQYKLFADIKKNYDQIRLLDAEGRELIRVNYHPAGSFITGRGELQDKSRRYYFIKSMKLKKGQVYISAFDLNVERGRVERPLKPVLRLATPIFAKDEKPVAVLVLNALGQKLLEHMNKSDIQAPAHIMLLNSRGYWLTGAPVEGYDWAFMFPNSSRKNMPGLWPDPWRILNQSRSGQFETERGIFTFSRLCPYRDMQSCLTSANRQDGNDWFIVSWVPGAWLDRADKKALQRHLGVVGGVWVILGILAFFLARIRQARRKYQDALVSANQDLNQSLKRMHHHNQVADTVNHLSDLVQACASADEVHQAVTNLAPKLFPGYRGELSTISKGGGLSVAARWGVDDPEPGLFDQSQCWAIRRGKAHLTAPGHRQPPCGHMGEKPDKLQLCVPLIAHGATVGVFSLESVNGEFAGDEEEIRDLRLLAANVAEMIALSLSNISLRKTLKEQSIRDVLTGLYNRRFMEESLAREEARALRSQTPLSLIMMDVDHFKRFNDEHGHEVGDEVLKNLGSLLKSQSRKDDVACRYGGEEFLLILPGAHKANARTRAEHIRDSVQGRLKVTTANGAKLGVTISLGVAALPEDGDSADEVLRLADEALLLAKQKGRNQVAGSEDLPPDEKA